MWVNEWNILQWPYALTISNVFLFLLNCNLLVKPLTQCCIQMVVHCNAVKYIWLWGALFGFHLTGLSLLNDVTPLSSSVHIDMCIYLIGIQHLWQIQTGGVFVYVVAAVVDLSLALYCTTSQWCILRECRLYGRAPQNHTHHCRTHTHTKTTLALNSMVNLRIIATFAT